MTLRQQLDSNSAMQPVFAGPAGTRAETRQALSTMQRRLDELGQQQQRADNAVSSGGPVRQPSYANATPRSVGSDATGATLNGFAVAAASTGPNATPSLHVPARTVIQPRALYNEAPVSIATAEVVRADVYTGSSANSSGRHTNNGSSNEDEPVAATAFLASDLIFEVDHNHRADFARANSTGSTGSSDGLGSGRPNMSRELSVRHVAVASPYVHSASPAASSPARAAGIGADASASAVAAALNARTLPELIVEGQASSNNNRAGSRDNRSTETRWW